MSNFMGDNERKVVLSLDIPWGIPTKTKYVGAAVQKVCHGSLVDNLLLTSVGFGQLLPDEYSQLPKNDEIEGFIANGAGPDRAIDSDVNGPFNTLPHTEDDRRTYLSALWAAFHRVRKDLKLCDACVDLLLVDMPLVPSRICQLSENYPEENKTAGYRPIETAFGNRVFIPGVNKLIQFARFQAGIVNGSRPGYAVCELAKNVFNADRVVESFPQLTLGPLAEFSKENGIELIRVLSAHKSGKKNVQTIEQGQCVVETQCTKFLRGANLSWLPDNLGPKPRSDAYDALLGLLPGLVFAGYQPPDSDGTSWRKAVMLKNLDKPPETDVPKSQGPGNPATGCRAWINDSPSIQKGIDDSGILCLDLSLWGK